MAVTVNIHEAKTELSGLLERVAAGEHIVIAEAGKPIAHLVPHRLSPISRGRSFDEFDPDIQWMFGGQDRAAA